jgi:CheY-like chemotaxis protein
MDEKWRILSRMFDVFGIPIDRQAALTDVQWRSAHRAPPPLGRRAAQPQGRRSEPYELRHGTPKRSGFACPAPKLRELYMQARGSEFASHPSDGAPSAGPSRIFADGRESRRVELPPRGYGTRKQMANVLIVDDDPDTVEVSSALLESAGHRITRGGNGEEGLKSLVAGPLPDCVLLDVEMPVLSGPEMARRMRLHDAGEERIPIVLVSGRDDLSAIAARMGTPYFLRKATRDYAEALLKLIERALSERRSPAAA